MHRSSFAVFCLAMLAWISSAAAPSQHVILISIDALEPGVYLDFDKAKKIMPNIYSMMRNGSYSQHISPEHLSATYPNHVTTVTGVSPEKHGIKNNYDAKSDSLHLDAKRIEATSIWDTLANAKLTTASINWPVSYSANVRYLIPQNLHATIPEIDTDFNLTQVGMLDLIKAGSTAELFTDKTKDISNPIDLKPISENGGDPARINKMTYSFAKHVIEQYQPNLVLMHFVGYSDINPANRQKELTPKVLAQIDKYIGDLQQTIKKQGIADKTTFIIVGVKHFGPGAVQQLNIRLLMMEAISGDPDPKTFEMPSSIAAWIVKNGRGAVITPSRNSSFAGAHAQLKTFLDLIRSKYSEMIAIRDTKLGMPGISDHFIMQYLEAKAGYIFSLKENPGDKVIGPNMSQHTQPELFTGFIASGAGVNQGVVLPSVSIIDIAPTITTLLGVDMPSADGKPLQSIVKD